LHIGAKKMRGAIAVKFDAEKPMAKPVLFDITNPIFSQARQSQRTSEP
jgi:hypothetical protein